MSKSAIDRYTNYTRYKFGSQSLCRPIDEERLSRVVEACRDLISKPYLRFMYRSGEGEPCAIVYDGETAITKLVTLSVIEEMITAGKFTK